MLAGGSDAPISPMVIAGYIKVGALSTEARRPSSPPGRSTAAATGS